ncbi:hypothetical protein ES703_31952 [subsurface metagenome]
MQRFLIWRFINGVVLNPKEFVLTRTGRVKWFKNKENAEKFLLKAGVKREAIGDGIYVEEV